MANAKQNLAQAASENDKALRALRITAVLTKYLKKFDIYPVLVGDAAVEFYSQGGYTTSDIDLVAPHSEELLKTMKKFGFQQQGRYFVNKPLKILIEFPSSSLGIEEKIIGIEVDGEIIRIISLEDLIIDRLEAAKWGKSQQDSLNAAMLLRLQVDLSEVRKKAQSADVSDTLEKILTLMRKKKMQQR